MCSRSIHIVACVRASLLFMAESYSTVWDPILCIHPSIHPTIHRYLGCFYFLAVVISAAMHIRVQTFSWRYTLYICLCFSWVYSPIYTPRSGVARLYRSSTFNMLWSCQTVFQSVCALFHPHQPCRRVPISIHILVNTCYYLTLILAI